MSRFLPVQDDNQSFWWEVTGRHVARMMHEAGYPVERQVELLLFHRFIVVPRLGPQPTSAQPSFRSRVAPGAGDGTPIGYSWRWGVGDSKPYIRHYVEPRGALTGTAADPLNEIAAKEMLWELGKILPTADLSLVWKFAAHLRPNLTDEATRQVSGSSMLVGLEWAPESNTVDVMAGLITRAPAQVTELLDNIIPKALRDAYGADVPLDCVDAVRDFIATDPHGQQLTVLGTTAIDCCKAEVSRFKFYVMTRNTSFDHIAAVMTLGGRKPAPSETIDQLRELWYQLKGLEADFPASAELPSPDGNGAVNGSGGGKYNNPNGITFYFDIHPKYALPHVKVQIDVSKHAKSDMAAAEAVTGFLQRRGRGRDAQAYMNVLLGMVPAEELRTRRGLQAFFAFAIKNGEIDITSYFLPQVYRRFAEIKAELNKTTIVRQRRSLFE